MCYSVSSYFITVIFSVKKIHSGSSKFRFKLNKSLWSNTGGFPTLVVLQKAEKSFSDIKWEPGFLISTRFYIGQEIFNLLDSALKQTYKPSHSQPSQRQKHEAKSSTSILKTFNLCPASTASTFLHQNKDFGTKSQEEL